MEMVVVIAITGVVAAMVSIFLRGPVLAYVDTARRAQLTEDADIALRRLARDVRTALTGSVRIVAVGTKTYLEFIPIVSGGRYRAYPSGDALDFDGDSSFDVLGPVPVYAAGQSIVIPNPGNPLDAYDGSKNNRAELTSSNANVDLFSSDTSPHSVQFVANTFPYRSPVNRFYIADQPVTYECDPDAGLLRRYANYGFQTTQPKPPAGATSSILVSRVGAICSFSIASSAHTSKGILTIALSLTDGGETIQLVHFVQVQNSL